MSARQWVMAAIGVMVGWIGIGVDQAKAVTAIYSNPSGLSVSIYAPYDPVTCKSDGIMTYRDVTGCWFPEWAPGQNETVYVVITGTGITSGTSVALTAATTSYTGNCSNYPISNPDTGYDFLVDPTVALLTDPAGYTGLAGKYGFSLTSKDCGGKAAISIAGTYTVNLPQDTDGDGLPDIWEAKYGFNINSAADGQLDNEANGTNPDYGDGFAAIDEYRGFIVNGQHIRTDPNQKDLFVGMETGQCRLTTDPATYLPATLFENLNTLISGTQIHKLNSITDVAANPAKTLEWKDRFISWPNKGSISYDNSGTPMVTPPADDRTVLSNNIGVSSAPQKGVRIIECLDFSVYNPYGDAYYGTINSSSPGDATLYTRRINYNMYSVLFPQSNNQLLKYSTYSGSAWSTPTSSVAIDGTATDISTNTSFFFTKAVEYYLAMEVGHVLKLTPTVDPTYGAHLAPKSGDNLDQALVNNITTKTVKGKTSVTGNEFYISSIYNNGSLSSYLLNTVP